MHRFYKCRCSRCRQENTLYQRERRARERSVADELAKGGEGQDRYLDDDEPALGFGHGVELIPRR
jgi:hypothetical protein